MLQYNNRSHDDYFLKRVWNLHLKLVIIQFSLNYLSLTHKKKKKTLSVILMSCFVGISICRTWSKQLKHQYMQSPTLLQTYTWRISPRDFKHGKPNNFLPLPQWKWLFVASFGMLFRFVSTILELTMSVAIQLYNKMQFSKNPIFFLERKYLDLYGH